MCKPPAGNSRPSIWPACKWSVLPSASPTAITTGSRWARTGGCLLEQGPVPKPFAFPSTTPRPINCNPCRSPTSSASSSTSRSSISRLQVERRASRPSAGRGRPALHQVLPRRDPASHVSTRKQGLPRLQRHLMHTVLLDSSLREWKRERRASVPSRPLVHVVRTEEYPALPRHQVKRAFVKVRKVPRQAFGRTKPAAHLLHRLPASAQRTQSRSCVAPNHRKTAEHQMIDYDWKILSPLPLTQVRRTAWLLHCVFNRGCQQAPIVGVPRRQPARRLLGEHILKPDRRHIPAIALPTQIS